MATVDELNFRLIIDDSEFNQKVKDVKATAEQLNRDLSDILDIKNKVTRIGKDDVASAKQQNQILKDNAKTQEAIAREVEKTAQANRKLRATTDSNIAKTQAVDQEKIAQATIKTATAQERLNQLIKRGSGELNRHSKLWQQIKNLSTVYFSVAGASRMISALVRTTAEFELQRTTLGAILQDVEKANVLYEQMKELAVKSPFNFKELATYAKQLSAYSIPVDQLYDTTKMLADVSAGLGVGMDRLVLAYGQIRSASFLRGQEVRQLTEAGIPILEELRKQFVELGEEGITVGDVFDKISKRLVPFEMVSKVFTDMTSEGGKFYQMQEVQAETLRGKLSNLKDAFQIMLSEIGENQDGLLKGSVNALRSLAENYEKVGRLVVTLVSTYGAYKAALIGIRIWQSAEVLAMTKGIGAYKKLGKAIEIATTESKAFAAIQRVLSKINPWVAIGAAVAGLAIHFIQVGAEARKFRKELEQMANTKFAEADKSVETFQRLAKQLKNSTEGSQAYRDAISQLNRQYGDYLPNLLNEKNALNEILAVENEVTNAIYARAKAYASEEGMRKIEDKYGEDVRSQGDVLAGILKNYWANPSDYGLGIIGEESASTFLKGFRDALEKDDGDAVKIFKNEMTDFFGWAPENFDESLIRKYARAVRSMYDETERFEKSIDRQFGSQGYSSFIEASVLKPIEAAFNKAKQELDSTTMSVDEYNEALNNLKLNRLYQIKAAYEDLDAESGKPGSYLNKIKEIQAQIDALKPKDLGWLQKLVNPLVTGKGNNDLKAQIEDGYDEYVDKLRKEYKAVTEAYADSDKTFKKLNEDKQKGLLADDDILKKATEQNELYEHRKKVIEDIAKALGVSVEPSTTGQRKGAKSQEQKDIETRIDLLKKLQSAYEKLSEYVSDEEMPDLLSKFFASSEIKDKDKIIRGMDYRKQLINASLEMEKYDKEAAEKLRTSVAYDEAKEAQDEYKEEAKRLREFAKRVDEYVEEAKSNAEKIKDLEKAMNDDLEQEPDESRKAAIIAHYTAEIEKLKEELGDITSIQLTDFWQQLTGEKNGTYGNLTRLQKKAEDLRDALKNITPNRDKNGKITGYTLTQKNNGDILKTLGIDAESLQLSVAQVEALNKGIEKLISQRAEKNGIFALIDALGSEGGFKTFWEDIKNGNGNAVAILKGIGSQASELGNIFTDLGEAMDSDFLTSLGDTFSFIGGFTDKLANGDWIGAVGEIVKALTGWITAETKLNKAIAETADQAERAKAALRLDDGVDTLWGENTLAKIRNAINLIKEYGAATESYRNQANRTITWKSGIFNWGRSSKSLSAMVAELGYDLYDAYGNLNAEALQAILDTYENLTNADREWIGDAIKNSEIYADSMERLNDVIKDTWGNLASDMADKLITARKEVGDAYHALADDLRVTFADMADDIAHKLVESFIIDQILNNYKDDLEAIYNMMSNKGSEEQIAQAFASMTDNIIKDSELAAKYTNYLYDAFEKYGISFTEGSENLADGIKGITEDTANLLASYLNAIRADVSFNKTQIATISTDIKQILGLLPASPTLNDYLNQIQANTFNSAYRTEQILSRIDSMMGLGGEGSALRVITT